MTRIQGILLLILLLINASCTRQAGQVPLATAMVLTETPLATATASPTVALTSTPTTMLTATVTPLLSTPTANVAVESNQQNNSSEGLVCSTWLGYVKMLGLEEGWIVGADDVILSYKTAPGDDTPTWQQIPLSEAVIFSSLSMVSPTERWAIGGLIGGGILHYRDGVWRGVGVKDPPLRASLFELDMLNEEEGWAVGEKGTILHFIEEEWQKFQSPTNERLHSVEMVSSEEGWAAGVGNAILHYQNQQWQEVPLSNWTILNDIEMVSPEEGWIVGEFAILHYQNGQWEEALVPWALKDVAMVRAEEGWAVGRDGVILHYQQGAWQEVSSPTKNSLLSIDMVSAEEGWAVGWNCTILHYQNGVWTLVNEAQ